MTWTWDKICCHTSAILGIFSLKGHGIPALTLRVLPWGDDIFVPHEAKKQLRHRDANTSFSVVINSHENFGTVLATVRNYCNLFDGLL